MKTLMLKLNDGIAVTSIIDVTIINIARLLLVSKGVKV